MCLYRVCIGGSYMKKQCKFLFLSILALSFFIPNNIYANEINYDALVDLSANIVFK